MKRISIIIIVLNLIVFLFFFNSSIFKKESLLKDGKLMYLKLAPVDPRSIMQGDYMRLNYDFISRINLYKAPKRGYLIFNTDSGEIGSYIRIQKSSIPINTNEYPVFYSSGNWQLKFGGESYFIEEGSGSKYDSASYGGFKIDKQGHCLLIGLYDQNLKKL